MELGRERAGADARAVGLQTPRTPSIAWGHAGPARRRRRARRGRDERIRAVVEVEQRRLGALEQHRVALCHLPVQHQRPVGDARAVPLAAGREVGDHGVPVHLGRAARAAQHLLVVPAGFGQLAGSVAGRSRSPSGRRAGRPCPRRPARCRAASCRSCASPAPPRARASRSAVVGQDDVRAVGEQQVLADRDTPAPRSRPISVRSASRSTTTPGPMTPRRPRHDARREQVQREAAGRRT